LKKNAGGFEKESGRFEREREILIKNVVENGTKSVSEN
jgi:hypothetical protein